jgi:hypothetical protein
MGSSAAVDARKVKILAAIGLPGVPGKRIAIVSCSSVVQRPGYFLYAFRH